MIPVTQLVEVKARSEGSGFLIADGLILTAWHLIRPGSGQPMTSDVRIRVEGNVRPGIEISAADQIASLLWPQEEPGDDLDFALLSLKGNKKTDPLTPDAARIEPLVWSPLGSTGQVEVTAVGYPDIAIDRVTGRRDTKGITGWIQLADGLRRQAEQLGTLTLRLRDEDAPAKPPALAWPAMSGAAVFAGSVLVGVVRIAAEEQGRHQIKVLPVSRLFSRQDVVAAVLAAGHVLPHKVQSYSRSSESSRTAEAFENHRRALVARALEYDWWAHPIPLSLMEEGRRSIDSREALTRWHKALTPQHCIILGDPGSGKSGLVWWLAYELVSKNQPLVLVVLASRLRYLDNITLATLPQIAEPILDCDHLTTLAVERGLFLLLDGLDELVGAEVGGDRLASELLIKVLACLPRFARVVATCRTPAFALVERDLRRGLPTATSTRQSIDPYDFAIAQALGIEHESALFLKVLPVSKANASSYLTRNRVTKILVDDAMLSDKIAPFLSSPFLLRLLTLTLPRLLQREPIAVHDLYQAYVRAALSREDQSLSSHKLQTILRHLKDLAISPKTAGKNPYLDIALKANLLSQRGRRYEFSHYSLWEYFFASALFTQIVAFDSGILARLDLVGGYNINRMLVPMIIERLSVNSDNTSRLRAVAAQDYRDFLAKTGWRKSTGYGIHPSTVKSDDGTPAASFPYKPREAKSIHSDTSHGIDIASAISWYDAAVFALYTKGRLPTSDQITEINLDRDLLFWCADWKNENIAHISVYDCRAGEVLGLNPDVRLPRTALAIT